MSAPTPVAHDLANAGLPQAYASYWRAGDYDRGHGQHHHLRWHARKLEFWTPEAYLSIAGGGAAYLFFTRDGTTIAGSTFEVQAPLKIEAFDTPSPAATPTRSN